MLNMSKLDESVPTSFKNIQVDDLTWRGLNKIISELSEPQLFRLLNDEINGLKRPAMLERLHQRFTIVRAARERVEILQGLRI
jgi:hypothetical protein